MQNFNYSLSDLEYQMPWEREIYVALLIDELKKKKYEQETAGR